MDTNWWTIEPKSLVDTPFLAVYENRVRKNIETLIQSVDGDIQKLRPHIKTHKMGDVLELFKGYGITKVKCATIAEAELAAEHQIQDILLAFPLVGIKINRWIALIKKFPQSRFSTLVEQLETATKLDEIAQSHSLRLDVFLDLNTGMNRTGAPAFENLNALIIGLHSMQHIQLLGIHIYDGHLKGDAKERINQAASSYEKIKQQLDELPQIVTNEWITVAGGCATFPFYSKLEKVECSPGTFVFWDAKYQKELPEQPFLPALVVVGTVLSKPSSTTICIDIGYKAVASENPLTERLVFLNAPDLIPISHSEEHLVLSHSKARTYAIGDLVYAIPYHVCPCCALYETVAVVNDSAKIQKLWKVDARNRKITI